MKLKVGTAFLILFFLFSSCASHTSEDNLAVTTLKSTAAQLDSATDWTDSLEGDLLSTTYTSINGISEGLDRSVELLPLLKSFSDGKKIYPQITGSYSLDTSELPEGCFSVINDFLKALEKGESLENYFEESNVYSLVMFKYDLQRLYGEAKVSWHAIGEPFCGDGYFQCAARLFFESDMLYYGEHADAMIFVRKNESGFKIISVDLINSAGE